ncbi:DUF2249 domain-containing protein [uncultured Propionibacterium sp.]|uniref:DUF2249 domain-containing protein n=1 Tax=uncultured Propionibacterium sp. TaxID=218066 RepID=UPI00292EAED6|nr:DUF2249 domain-containing protein [uncultured Propionibacterium sp.]
MADLPITETHDCGCDGHAVSEPELDATQIPHEIRHAAILGALQGIGPGGSMILVAPHDPLPLLAQVDSAWPGAFAREYVQEGPDAWKIRFTRQA